MQIFLRVTFKTDFFAVYQNIKILFYYQYKIIIQEKKQTKKTKTKKMKTNTFIERKQRDYFLGMLISSYIFFGLADISDIFFFFFFFLVRQIYRILLCVCVCVFVWVWGGGGGGGGGGGVKH